MLIVENMYKKGKIHPECLQQRQPLLAFNIMNCQSFSWCCCADRNSVLWYLLFTCTYIMDTGPSLAYSC